MKVVLVGIPLSVQGFIRGASIAPYSLRLYCLADPALAERVEIAVVDPIAPLSDADLFDAVASLAPDVVGFNCYLWNRERLMALAAACRARFPAAILVAGGPDVGHVASRTIAAYPHLDAVCTGEGEQALRLLLRRLAGIDPEDWRDTPGFAVRNAGGARENPAAPVVDMDAIPSLQDDPEWVARYPTLFVQTSRGCHFSCTFCLYNRSPRRWRSLDLIRDELARWVARGGAMVDFIDAGINQDRGRMRAILQMLVDHPSLERPFLEMNVELLQRDDAALLARTTSRLAIGLQSASESTNRNVRRGFKLERFRDRIAAVREAGIDFSIDLVYGLPGDDYRSFKATIDEAYAMDPSLVHPFRLQVLPGSTLESEAERWGLKYQKDPWYWLQSSDTFGPEDMRAAARLAEVNDVLHTFTFRTTAFATLRSATGIGASALIEHLLSGTWRDRPVGDDELARWSDTRHLAELEGALREWVPSAVAASGYPDRLPWVAAAWELQFGLGRALIRDHVPVPDGALAWPPIAGARPHLSPNASVIELPERPGERSHVVVCRGPSDAVDIDVSRGVSRVLARLDGERDFDAIVAPFLDAEPDEERSALRHALWDRLGELTALAMVWWA